MTKKPYLSRYEYNAGDQCAKRLWLQSKEPDAPELKNVWFSPLRRLDKQEVTEVVRATFKDSRLVSWDQEDVEAGLAATQALLTDKAVKAVFNGLFLSNGLYSTVDVVEKSGKGLNVVTIKTGTKVKPEYLTESAIHTHVVGENVIASKVVTVKNTVRFPDVNDIVAFNKVTDDLADDLKAIPDKVAKHLKTLGSKTVPSVKPGDHCTEPYDCPFMERCHKPAAAKKKTLSVKKDELREELKKLDGKKVAYLDFETISPAIPFLAGAKAHMFTPVQFSCHVDAGKKDPTHHEWIVEPGQDPREKLVDALVKACNGADVVLGYHNAESRGLKVLAELLPKRADEILDIDRRMYDLRKLVCLVDHPDFKGGHKLKNVVPVLCPDISYDRLAIREGETAGAVLRKMMKDPEAFSAAEVKKMSEDLRAYCKVDTLAMVKLLERLRDLAA